MDYLSLFRMPTPMKITGRSSSIANAFINSNIPVVPPSADDVKQAMEILGMTFETFQCAYCGDKASAWDHILNRSSGGNCLGFRFTSPPSAEATKRKSINMQMVSMSFSKNSLWGTDHSGPDGFYEFLSRPTRCKVNRGTGIGQKTTANRHWPATSAAPPPSHRLIEAANVMKGA